MAQLKLAQGVLSGPSRRLFLGYSRSFHEVNVDFSRRSALDHRRPLIPHPNEAYNDHLSS